MFQYSHTLHLHLHMAWLDAMARNYYIYLYFYLDTQDHAIYRVWIHFVPTPLYPRRRKTFGLSWNQTQVHLLHKQGL